MLFKVGKTEINVHGGLIFLGLLVADSMYANHCKLKQTKYLAKKSEETEKKAEVEKEEES